MTNRQFSLVIQTSFLGDVVLTTPLIAELARRGPVHVVATPAGAPLLARNPDVAGVTIYDKRGRARGVGGLATVAGEISAARSRAANDGAGEAIAYLAQGSVRSAALARLAGFRTRVGFTTSAGRWLYTAPRSLPRRPASRRATLEPRGGDAGTFADERAAAPSALPRRSGAGGGGSAARECGRRRRTPDRSRPGQRVGNEAMAVLPRAGAIAVGSRATSW
jgi:hypothetical protein